MRNLDTKYFNQYRIEDPPAWALSTEKPKPSIAGRFYIDGIIVIATSGDGWDHVSVSHENPKLTPSWRLMCEIKRLFFHPDQVAIQIHPEESNYVNNKVNCLHLWRPHNKKSLRLPPAWMV